MVDVFQRCHIVGKYLLQIDAPFADEDLQEIKVRMDKLLEILDGSVEDDLPF